MRAFVILLAVIFMPASALAGETSRLNVLGFNLDGSVFAFEEYGIGDGLGLPYSSIFAIDVARDRWLPGTPVRIAPREGDIETEVAGDTLNDFRNRERSNLLAVRNQAANKFAPVLNKHGPLGFGLPRFRSSPWQLGSDLTTARFAPRSLLPSDGKGFALSLTTTDFPASDACYSMFPKMQGFTLTFTNEATGATRVLASDTRIPKSRGCPMNYTVEEVWTHDLEGGQFALAVLLRYKRPGFEGPDGRLLAVTAVVE